MNTQSRHARRHLEIDQLDTAIVTLAGRINAATYELLVLIREFDERGGFLKWSLHSCVEWLHWRCDLSPTTAREKVRVAHALKDLPEISSAFQRGALSYSKVRALTRVATPLNEATLVDFARTTTAARVEERCRQMRNATAASVDDANRAHARRGLSVWRNAARGTVTLTVELPLEEGELVVQALDKAMAESGAEGPEFEATSYAARQADALVDLGRAYLSGTPGEGGAADAYQVLVHVDAKALAGEDGRSDLPVETVRRLSCDGSVVTLAVDGKGEPLNIGRKRRTIPAAIRRALHARDRHCRFPGCTHGRYVEAHHVTHWSRGGETNLEGLVLLCTRHHRLLHEGGYEMRRDVNGECYFRRADGRVVPAMGYRSEDRVDDDVDAADRIPASWGASAEARSEAGVEAPTYEGVRETPARYPVTWDASAEADRSQQCGMTGRARP